MKTPAFLSAAALVVGVALGTTGCSTQPTIAGSHVASARPVRNFALSVSLPDGGQLTPQQWAIVKATFEAQLAAAGYVLVDDLSLADRIIRVVFTPAEDDPTNGNAVVMSVRPNPVYAYNTMPSFAPSYASMSGTNFFGYGASSFFNDNYYGYDSSYYSGSPRIDTPRNSRPSHPIDCPPGDNGSNNHASNRGHRGGGNDNPGPGGSYRGGGGSRSGGTYTRLDGGSNSTYSSSPSSNTYSSRSYSSPSSSSFSGGGSSSSYSSPSSSSYSGGGSSSSYSSPSSSSYSGGGSSSSYSSPSSSSYSGGGSSSSYSSPSSSSYSGGSSSSSSYSAPSSSSSGSSDTTPSTSQNAN